MKNVLVLGGGGFIGRNITEFLVRRGDCNVTAADIRKGSNWDKLSNEIELKNIATIKDEPRIAESVIGK